MPTGRELHADKPLSNLAVRAFDSGTANGERFIAPMVFPSVPVGNQSDNYYVIDKQAFLRVHDTTRSPRTKANRVHFDISSSQYYAKNYALGTDNSLEDLANADLAIQLRENGTELVTSGLLRDYELRVANIVTSLTNLGSGVALAGSTKFSDYVGSDPVGYVNTAHAFIRSQTGLRANTAIIDYDTLTVLRRHPAMLDMFKYTSGGELTDAQIASVFKVERMLIGEAVRDQSVEGQTTASMTNIWGNNLIIARIVPPAGLKTATFGLSFRWMPAGFPAPMSVGRQIFSGPGTENIEVIEGQYFQDEKVVAADLAYGIGSTL